MNKNQADKILLKQSWNYKYVYFYDDLESVTIDDCLEPEEIKTLSDIMNRTEIYKNDSRLDEAYCEWFKCPSCGYTMIESEAKYCGGCGKFIEWGDSK